MRKRVCTLVQVKENIDKLNGEYVSLKIHVGRNKFKDFAGVIESVYPAVFTVVGEDFTTRSFSYFDVACGDVKIL